MQRKKKMKNEKGSVAVIVTATLFSFYIILLGLYARASFVRRSQLMADVALKSHYEVEVVALMERAQNAGFAWKKANESYENKVAKMTFYVEDNEHNIDMDLFTKNLFNGNFIVGHINKDNGAVDKDKDSPNSIYTDLIHVGSSNVYRCFGQDTGKVVTWLSYREDGSFISSATGDIYTKPGGAAYFRVMWESGITTGESEKIYIYSSYTGDTSTPVYAEPSNKIRVLINGIDITDKACITAYEVNTNSTKRKEFVLEVRDVPTDGPLKIKIPENSISRKVDEKTEYNYQNIYYSKFIVTQ